MIRKTLQIITMTFCSFAFAQEPELPNVIPPSPEASSITKYVDMKINEYQGMIQHQIPIYQITDGSIQLPISLSYQSGGFKVSESSSSIGLGWSLSAGGVISRNTQGLPDDADSSSATKGFLQLSNEVTYNYLLQGNQDAVRYDYLQNIGNGCYDSQPDIFNFNFNGYSGKFHFDWNGNIIVSSENPITITPIQPGGNLSRITGWTVKTPDGFTYTFTSAETTTNISTTGASFCYSPTQSFLSSWYLTEISDGLGQRKLTFEYDTYHINDHYIFRSESRQHQIGGASQCGGSIAGSLSNSTSNVSITGKALRRITSNTSLVEVLFVPGSTAVMNTSTDFYAISEIQIRNKTENNLIKKYVLNHSQSTGRLTLASVQEYGASNQTLPPYEFFYHGSLPTRTSIKKDHWGYTNNNTSTSLLPPYIIPVGEKLFSFGLADRSPDFTGSRNGILYKIKYPTGGYDQYTFEQNTFGYVAGVAIDEFETTSIEKNVQAQGNSAFSCTSIVTNTDTDTFTVTANPSNPNDKVAVRVRGTAQKHTGDYFSGGKTPKATVKNSQGNIIVSISLTNADVHKYFYLDPGTYTIQAEATWRNCENTSFDKASLTVYYDTYTNTRLYEKPIGGVRVKSIDKYDHTGTILLSQQYSYTDDQGYSSGFTHKLPNYVFDKESLQWIPSGSGGYNITCQSLLALDSDRSGLGMTTGGHLGYKKVTITQQGGDNGSTELNFTGSANIINETVPFPPPIDRSAGNGKLLTSKVKNKDGNTLQENTMTYQNKEVYTNAIKVQFKGGIIVSMGESHFYFGPYRVLMAHNKVSAEENTSFLHGNALNTKTEYTYDSSLQRVKEQKVYHSEGTNREVFYYPEEHTQLPGVSSTEASSYQNLVSDFRISQPIQADIYRQNTGEPETLLSTQRTVFSSASNITSGYTLPVTIKTAKAEGSLENRIQYHRYDDLGNPVEVSKTNSSHMIYIWGYQDQFPIAKVENATYADVAAYVTNLKQKSNADIDRTIGNTGTEGALRLDLQAFRGALPNAMVTTYTYDPLIGVTSITDPRGYTIYYQYDQFNRLQYVKDADGNLVSENQYNYKN
ncbi:RHS repeat domain-containing protein [Aquimarina sp. 2201CG5-10]|uniref:RHS repeat domain-containing protein n=1 Tax=Aquimarina callyspongiae TaxID=3098150 RepID=UPI002AB3A1A0|nr:RHS repeat domain-containing protein [Aquimarina sp. 2201CG5-10]MDY8138917.1 RHS repeat domain-containing protein [Aquimarina sp. 2201CG5-10]